ncbi:MAG: MMPL family transporter [Verrucomicrobiales bacterium]|nr:MMPL family transporter [Verrucomicrobiales bacterium]
MPFLLLIGGLTLFFGYHCLHLEVDRDNRSMDADNEVQAALETEFRETFSEGDSIFVAIYDEKLSTASGQERVRQLEAKLGSLDGVESVFSAVDFDFEVPDSQRGILLSEDGNMAGLRLIVETFDDQGQKRSALIEEIKAIAAEESREGRRVAVTGLPVQKYEVGILVRRDQRVFAPLSLLVLGLVLLFVTRRLSGMLFPLLVSTITICWTLGIYSIVGNTLNMITSLLPPVIMTLSVATTIHIYLDWLHEAEMDNRKRILAAVKNLYRPCLFASLTTAIGFMSLLLSETPAVRLFGMFAALGVGISYLLGVFGIAVGLSFLKPPVTNPDESPDHAADAHRVLDFIAGLTVNHPVKIILVALILGVVGVFGMKRIETDTDLLNFLGEKHSLVKDTRFIDEHLAGISRIELFLKKSDGEAIGNLDALIDFEDAIDEAEHVRQSFGFSKLVPEEVVGMIGGAVSLGDVADQIDSNAYLGEGLDRTRITVFTDSIGTLEGTALIHTIREIAADKLGDTFELGLVGGFYRVIEDSNQLVASQLKSFLLAILLILIAIGIVFRSLTYTFLAFIPNFVPLLLTAAVMGFTGIAMSTGTAMIASVVIGIAVDDTIHYLSAYRKAGHTGRAAAIRKTTRSTGFVLLATTMALSAGFWVAIFGSFQPTIFFALLAGMTMWFALACDLLALPAFLRLAAPCQLEKDKKSPKP